LVRLPLGAFVPPNAPVAVGIDEHLERRRGATIAERGIDRDPVRSSKALFVETSGLRWISMPLLAPIRWARRVRALPSLTAPAPPDRYPPRRRQRHKTITDWARQMVPQLGR
jgi:hypothetical protein